MHVHQSICKGGKPCLPATAMPACPRPALYYIGGIIKHAAP
jgi:glutamine synthetase